MKFTRGIPKKPITINDVAFYNKKIHDEKRYEFASLFKFNLLPFLGGDAITLLTGFNIIKFDEAIKTPDGTSTKDWIIKKYGKEAGDLIDWLIKHTGLPE